MIGDHIVLPNTAIAYNNDNIIITSFKAYIVIPSSTDTTIRLLDIEESLTCSLSNQAEIVIFGIDSIQTIRTDFTGDLDPVHGMFWTWNSGYINVKIEGISQRSTQRNHIFQMHLGGYFSPYQTAFSLKIPQRESFEILMDIGPCIDALLTVYQGTAMSPGKQAHELMNILQQSMHIE